jgi:hypothetical protein
MKLTVRTPCRENWDAMSGDAKRRFCDSCQKRVHHLSAMTEAEATAIAKRPGVCGRFRRDADGEVVFADSAPSLGRLAKQAAAVVIAASVVSTPALAGGQAANPEGITGNWLVDLVMEATGVAPTDPTPDPYEDIMGDIAWVQPDAETRTVHNRLTESVSVDCQGTTLTIPPGDTMALESEIGGSCTAKVRELSFVLASLETRCEKRDGAAVCFDATTRR